jgi:hypothetical protein
VGNDGGLVTVRGGAPADGRGGGVAITGRDGATGTAANRNGGSVTVIAGNAATAGTGGGCSIDAGSGGATGTAGVVTITAGAGGATSGNGGLATLRGGLPVEGNGGGVDIIGRNAATTGASNFTGGAVSLTGGNAVGNSTGGNLLFTPGTSPTGTQGCIDMLGQVAWDSQISPAALGAGDNDDWAPTGLGTANLIRATPDAGGSNITGITTAGNCARKLILLHNLGSADITLVHEDAGSTAGFRFNLPNAANVVIRDFGSIWIWYDTTASRWKVLSI